MFAGNQNFTMVRFLMIFVLLAGMLGVTPVSPAHAATILVTNTNPTGPGSLASAILNASSSDTIVQFDPSLAGQTITFTSQIAMVTVFDLTIDGSGLNPPVVVSGGNTSGILKITGPVIFDVSNITFTQASAADGAAIQLQAVTQSDIENCIFLQNHGGALSVAASGPVTVLNSTFDQNEGRALSVTGAVSTVVVNSKFIRNSSGGNGGAIATTGGLTVIDSTFSGNLASGNAGAIYAPTNLLMKNTTVTENQANGDGGAFYLPGNTSVTIVNSTVFQNRAGDNGGAMFVLGNADIEIVNSTFAGNTAASGKELFRSGTASLSLRNSIFVCTTGGSFENCYTEGLSDPISIDHSILGVGLLVDYGLAEPADNGGPTQTMALLPGSPLIDAGDDVICAGADVNNLDQRGVTRPQGSHCDIGAYEDQSSVRYVRQEATGTGDGLSWANAYTDLQSALAAASPDEEIWVAAGTYKPTSTSDRSISFELQDGVSIYGGFTGIETTREQRDYETNLTILSGDIGATGNDTDNSYHVVVANGVTMSAWLDGFTITGGNANDALVNTGGGMDVQGGSPSLVHVIFENNHATFGGGMHVTGTPPASTTPVLTDVTFRANSAVEGGGMRNFQLSHPILTNVLFDNNSVTRSGGGMENFNFSNPALTNVTFKDNTAGDLGAGGGMYNWVGNIPILMNVNFIGNIAQWGGGMGNYQSSPILHDVVFSKNLASWYGGGMSNDDNSNPQLTDVTFDGNIAASDTVETAAGGMHNRGSSPKLNNVTFKENSANYIGGGMVNEVSSSPELVNVTFSGNSADYGGALVNRDSGSSPILTHVTISNNTALGDGGAIANTGNPVITNSILWGNAGGSIFNLSGTPVITYSIVQGGYDGLGNLDENPLLGPLQDNGGPTETMALGDGSPAINAADDTNCPTTDQRGLARPQGSHCDMGAYEYDRSTVEVIIGPSSMDSYLLDPHESQRQSYPGVNSGPVKLTNQDNASIIAAERVLYKVNGLPTSFSEMMGLPDSQLDTMYWLPWYNNVDLDTQLRFANVSGLPASVHIFIGGQEMGTGFTLDPGESTRQSFSGINDGPVKIVSDQDIVAAERVIYKVRGVNTSFSEMMALPNSQLDKTYWLPWYNNVDLDTQLRFANTTDQPATVHVFIAGQEMGTGFTLDPGESTRQSFADMNSGPVKIVSDQNVVVAERVVYKVNGVQTSFSETMALPENQLDTTHWLPWYNNIDLDTQLRFANTTDQTATVHIFIGGQERGTGFTLDPGESTRQSFPGINDGPVKVVSDQNIVVAERVIYRVSGIGTSFSELMALPDNRLDATYWFPWYNNVDLDTQLRFGLP